MLVGIITPQGEKVEWKDALERAEHGDPSIGYPYSIIAAVYDDYESNRYPISASQFGTCMRQSYLKHITPYYETPGSRLPMLMGTWAHSIVEDYPHPQSAVEVEMVGYTQDGVKVTGIIDDLHTINDGLEYGIHDWKTTRWLNPKNVPYGSHATQVNVYRWLAEQNGYPITQLSIVYVDLTGPAKNGSHPGVYEAPIELWDWEKLDAFITERATILLEAFFPNGDAVMPPMVAPNERQWMCKRYCPASIKARCDQIGE